ncbi:hypothetical protein IJI76_00530 [Candidatus Saccharibacteria bacterium]|nr:hypothetical protein [Candidatus Saccharibacteria bacterium]
MKSFKYILSSLALTLSMVLPVANASAIGGTVSGVIAYVDGNSLHVKGEASGGTNVVAISVYDETGTSMIAGPETTETDENYRFNYDFSGSFDTDTTYTICAADYDGGLCMPTQTKKLIKSVNVTVKNPIEGDEVKEDTGGFSPDKIPEASASSDEYEMWDAWWTTVDGIELFYGVFEKDTDYYAFVDLGAAAGYIFTENTTVKVNGIVNTNITVWPDGSGLAVIATLRVAEDAEPIPTPDSGTAPITSVEITKDKAVTNISLGVSIVIASAITYGVYLINKKSERK